MARVCKYAVLPLSDLLSSRNLPAGAFALVLDGVVDGQTLWDEIVAAGVAPPGSRVYLHVCLGRYAATLAWEWLPLSNVIQRGMALPDGCLRVKIERAPVGAEAGVAPVGAVAPAAAAAPAPAAAAAAPAPAPEAAAAPPAAPPLAAGPPATAEPPAPVTRPPRKHAPLTFAAAPGVAMAVLLTALPAVVKLEPLVATAAPEPWSGTGSGQAPPAAHLAARGGGSRPVAQGAAPAGGERGNKRSRNDAGAGPSARATMLGAAAPPTAPPPPRRAVAPDIHVMMLGVLEAVRKFDETDLEGIFGDDLDEASIEDYVEEIDHPMDLPRVTAKLERGGYPASRLGFNALQADLRLIGQNCMAYNPHPNAYHDMGQRFVAEVERVCVRAAAAVFDGA